VKFLDLTIFVQSIFPLLVEKLLKLSELSKDQKISVNLSNFEYTLIKTWNLTNTLPVDFDLGSYTHDLMHTWDNEKLLPYAEDKKDFSENYIKFLMAQLKSTDITEEERVKSIQEFKKAKKVTAEILNCLSEIATQTVEIRVKKAARQALRELKEEKDIISFLFQSHEMKRYNPHREIEDEIKSGKTEYSDVERISALLKFALPIFNRRLSLLSDQVGECTEGKFTVTK